MVETIRRNAARMTALVSDLSDVVRIERNALQLVLERCEACALLKDAVEASIALAWSRFLAWRRLFSDALLLRCFAFGPSVYASTTTRTSRPRRATAPPWNFAKALGLMDAGLTQEHHQMGFGKGALLWLIGIPLPIIIIIALLMHH